jgi:hypothetical protein
MTSTHSIDKTPKTPKARHTVHTTSSNPTQPNPAEPLTDSALAHMRVCVCSGSDSGQAPISLPLDGSGKRRGGSCAAECGPLGARAGGGTSETMSFVVFLVCSVGGGLRVYGSVDGLRSLTWAGGQVVYVRLGVCWDLVGWDGMGGMDSCFFWG